jgi:TrmH family RNA methyltransferase
VTLHAPRFVLLRPHYAGNVGSAARALKNFGHRDWAWVDPEPFELEEARRMAVQSSELLEGVVRPKTLGDAISDCVWVVGTTSRQRRGMRRLTPRAFAEEAAQRLATGPVALVFGDERSGLSNEELDRCHDGCAIPTDDAQPSMNLAQALLLLAYELRLAMDGARVPSALPKAATDGDLRRIETVLEQVLSRARFLNHDPRPVLQALLGTLVRARMSAHEGGLWNAALSAVEKRLPEQ